MHSDKTEWLSLRVHRTSSCQPTSQSSIHPPRGSWRRERIFTLKYTRWVYQMKGKLFHLKLLNKIKPGGCITKKRKIILFKKWPGGCFAYTPWVSEQYSLGNIWKTFLPAEFLIFRSLVSHWPTGAVAGNYAHDSLRKKYRMSILASNLF